MKKFITVSLFFLLFGLQYRLWFGKHSVPDYWIMKEQIAQMQQQNRNLVQRNNLLKADIDDLKTGLEAIEERARSELGLIKQGETFFRILPNE
jgi:cell division protein FtsB